MNAMANTSTYLHVVAILSIFCYLFILYNRFPNTKFQLYLQQELVFVDCFFFVLKRDIIYKYINGIAIIILMKKSLQKMITCYLRL